MWQGNGTNYKLIILEVMVQSTTGSCIATHNQHSQHRGAVSIRNGGYFHQLF